MYICVLYINRRLYKVDVFLYNAVLPFFRLTNTLRFSVVRLFSTDLFGVCRSYIITEGGMSV